jgi:hypothetical protein
MDLKTLLNKTLSGAKYILAQPTMMFRNKQNVPIIATHVVKEILFLNGMVYQIHSLYNQVKS